MKVIRLPGRALLVSAVLTWLALCRLVWRRPIFGDERFSVSSRLFALAAGRHGLRCWGFYFLGIWPLPWLQLARGHFSFIFKGLPSQRLDRFRPVNYTELSIVRWDEQLLDQSCEWRVWRVICVGFGLVAGAEVTHRNTLYDVTSYIHPHTRTWCERVATEIGWPLVGLTIVGRSLGSSPDRAPGLWLAQANPVPPLGEHLQPTTGEPQDVASALAELYDDNFRYTDK